MFKNFKAIDTGEFRQVVWYYERHQKAILALEFEEYFEMLVAYTHALFQVNEYKKHLEMADIVIEISIIENINYVNGEEIFKRILFQKAASHYNILEYKKAIHVLRELLKIEPDNYENRLFLEKCLRDNKPEIIRLTRAVGVFLFLFSAFTISIEVLVVRNFYPEFTYFIEIFRNTAFGLGLLTLLGGIIWDRWWSFREVRRFVQEAKKRKKMF